jgi:magnesium and cobalt transporter
MEELIEEGTAEGLINSEEEEMLLSVLDFRSTLVREVMVPRTEMICAEVSCSVKELTRMMVEEGHSRIPVYEGEIDRVIGVAHARDLLPYWERAAETPGVGQIIRPAFFVPETMRLEMLLGEFRRRKTHIAVAVDEYGGVSGLVTLEDVLEEIVGDIRDEWDEEAETLLRETPDGWEVDARLDIETLEEKTGVELPLEGEFETVGGLCFRILGRVPTPGEKFSHGGLEFVVRSADNRRVKSVFIRKAQGGAADGGKERK